MRLKALTATPHPAGNRIDLQWVNPEPDAFAGVRVVRRDGTHPANPEDGVIVAEGDTLLFTENPKGERQYRAEDAPVKAETIYYYTLFPYQGDPPSYLFDPHNRVAAMATACHDMAGQLYDLLPAIYHRYDRPLPESADELSAVDRQKGQLRRFLDLPGSQLDLLYSFARNLLNLYHLDKVDGALLPLIAQWIGWQTDYRLEVDAQRNEIRYAPHVYKRIGIIPTVEATVKRILGWESRTKEFAHNVAFSNRPERLNLWLRERGSNGQWSDPTAPLSIDFAYEGRPTTVTDTDGTLWLFFHTERKQDKAIVSVEHGLDSGDAPKRWIRKGQWDIWYKIYRATSGWSPSRPLTNRSQLDKHPSAANHGGTIWLFWDTWSDTERRWCIAYSILENGAWSSPEAPWEGRTEQRDPCAATDDQGGLWLFWRERDGARWDLKYNRHDGADWELPVASPGSFRGSGADPQVDGDVFVRFHPTDPTRRLWVFWGRSEPISPTARRWRIAYRTKADLDPATWNWSTVATLPVVDPEASDREPALVWDPDGNPELFWASNRDRSWSVWRSKLDLGALSWESPEALTGNPFSQRAPFAATVNGRTLLFYRSNASLSYPSALYKATTTRDSRYAGCTTVDTRNVTKISLRGQYEDFQTYTYDVGRNGNRTAGDWYARDTVGIYLTPDTEDPTLIQRNRELIEGILKQFLPIQVRTVFIIEPAKYKELLYTYEFPKEQEPRIIAETVIDSLISETYSGLGDHYRDTIPGWTWIRAWSVNFPDHRTVDFNASEIDTGYRTWHTGLDAGA